MAEVKTNGTPTKEKAKPKCGIVMPISTIDGCGAEHWAEVLLILKDCITSINFEPNLVSDADDIGIIQKRIIQNLYSNEIIVCDVSAKNPNVMFELGMRLAFDKPTIIIKDDKTDYTFDTSVIEHLTYPRDLRFTRILEFKDSLRKKIEGTYKASADPKYSTFLKNFGQYKVAQLHEQEVSSDEYILNSLNEIKSEINKLKNSYQMEPSNSNFIGTHKALTREEFLKYLIELFKKSRGINDVYAHREQIIDYVRKNPSIKKLYSKESELMAAIDDELLPF